MIMIIITHNMQYMVSFCILRMRGSRRLLRYLLPLLLSLLPPQTVLLPTLVIEVKAGVTVLVRALAIRTRAVGVITIITLTHPAGYSACSLRCTAAVVVVAAALGLL